MQARVRMPSQLQKAKKTRPIGYVTSGGFVKTAKGWRKASKQQIADAKKKGTHETSAKTAAVQPPKSKMKVVAKPKGKLPQIKGPRHSIRPRPVSKRGKPSIPAPAINVAGKGDLAARFQSLTAIDTRGKDAGLRLIREGNIKEAKELLANFERTEKIYGRKLRKSLISAATRVDRV